MDVVGSATGSGVDVLGAAALGCGSDAVTSATLNTTPAPSRAPPRATTPATSQCPGFVPYGCLCWARTEEWKMRGLRYGASSAVTVNQSAVRASHCWDRGSCGSNVHASTRR